ncbi:MAG: 4Fe-4S dicluster domain-containing protein [Chloroflexi bacterium]|jgi:heterodisulfide reductase subunit C|nr:4Fe-4S dicluster domain-containing protein [Chloroflexota bacterium]
MAETMVKALADVSFINEVCAIPGGEAIRSCIQCGVCTGSCPTANQWDYPPRRVIAMVRAGLRDELLSSNSMWFCVSCYSCTVRCPRDIKPADIMHALEIIAIRSGKSTKRSKTPTMYRCFVDSARGNGRVYELGMMIKLFLKTNPFAALKLAPVGLGLFFHKRLPLKPSRIKGMGELKAILNKARELGGAK